MKQRFFALLTALLLLVSLAGCAQTGPAPTEPATEPTAPATEAPTSKPAETEPPTEAPAAEALAFSTTTLDGEAVTAEDYRGVKLLLVNLWEPWCGPCVGEMPDLNRLYETYRDRGLVILGVFGDMEDDARAVVEENGIAYPILHQTADFAQYQTNYIPTTVLFDGDGLPLLDEPIIGAQSYEAWERIVLSYLGD